jgi:hypothetical protein
MPGRSRCEAVKFGKLRFGSIMINGASYRHDVVIDRGRILKRKKKPSKKYRERYGHTPVSIEEDMPWKCRRLVIGTGKYGSLPVMDEVKLEARKRGVNLLIASTDEAIEALAANNKDTNAILHVTC